MGKIIFIFTSFLLIMVSTACSGVNESIGNENTEEPQLAASNEGSTAEHIENKTELMDTASIAHQPPNGSEYNDMHFKHYGTNPFVSTEDDNQSTFAVDVDTGAYSVVRNYIQRGTLPPEEAVRVEEFINYFKSNVQVPKQNTFAIQVDGGDSPFGEGYQLMRVAVKGKDIKVQNRKDANLIFVIDVSGSMDMENRLGLVKKSLNLLVNELNSNDKVGIVAYGSRGRVLLEPTSVDEKKKIISAIEQLQPEGSTNAEEGLTLAYQLATEYFNKEGINRVILCSDGVANVGRTGHNEILKKIKEHADDEIQLSTFGFGMGNYNDVLMEQLADNGDGNYAYIDTFSEARRIFMEELTGTLQTIAKDVKIQVEFNTEVVDRYRLLGYENRDVRDEDFRNDSVDGGEIGAGHSVTALYELKVNGNPSQNLGTVRLRYQDAETTEVEEISQSLLINQTINKELKFLVAVAEFAEILRGSYWAKGGSLENVLKIAEETANNSNEMEFVELVKDTIALKNSKGYTTAE